MPDYPSTLHYLPIEVSGQLFAIPMLEVAAIRQLGRGDAPVVSMGQEARQPAIPIVDLQSLFFGVSLSDIEEPAYVIVISIPAFACAVLVDGVRPARLAEPADQLAMPLTLTNERYPFRGVLRTPEGLVLIIDSRLLIEELRRIKPDLIVEKAHGSR
ncbi:MAG: chemotaxis protein CheW [Anaerolineae bacterium]|nr:chemotaxis protein CheW [Anaerolineae bacterium]